MIRRSLFESSELLPEVNPIPSIRSLSLTLKRNEFLSGWLDFSALGLYGRDREISQLFEAYSCVQLEGKNRLVLLSGYTGVGKSAIVKRFQSDLKSEAKNGKKSNLFATGKFDLQRRVEPYKAVVAAFSQLCDGIISLREGREELFVRMKDSIKEALGSEAVILFDIMPNLNEILGISTSNAFRDSEDFGSSRAKNRFCFILRQFARAVCKFFPVVLFLDDLQWADAASIELLQTLMTDSEQTSLLVVGCYRSNEVDESHPLSATLGVFENHNDNPQTGMNPQSPDGEDMNSSDVESILMDPLGNTGVVCTRIHVGNLGLDVVHELITDTLHSEKLRTQNLAKILHEKTLGNAFFVIQFLKMMKDENLIAYNMGTLSWNWDDDKIRASTTVADNVADIVRHKIRNKLAPEVSHVLQMAACLGASFAASTILLVARTIMASDEGFWHPQVELEEPVKPEGDSSAVIQRCLRTSVEEGLLEVNEALGEQDEMGLHFVHDQIQSAAFSLIPEDRRELLQLRIGEALVENQTDAELEQVVFVAVDMLNNGMQHIKETEKMVSLAKLNLRAGRKAMESSAFLSASTYSSMGIELLGPGHWEKHYNLSLDLFNLIIKADYCNGKFDQVYKHVDQVLDQKDRPIEEKLDAYSSLVDSLGAQGKVDVAINTSLAVLAQLGAKFNLKFAMLSTVSELLKTRRLLKGRPLLTLSDLPEMKDKLRVMAMKIMNRCCTYAYAGKPELLPLLIFKMMQWTLQYGVCRYSTTTFALYGLPLVSLFGDLKSAHEIGQVALTLSDKLDARETRSATLAYVNACLSHWVTPLHVTRNQFLSGYEVGLRTGDIENAMLCAMNYCHACYETGQPLTQVETDLRAFTTQMKEHEQTLILNVAAVVWQAALNLIGDSDDPTVLTGEAMNQEEVLRHCAETGNVQLADGVKAFQMELAYFFGDFPLAARLACETRNLAKTNPASYAVWRCSLFEGLTAFAMTRHGKKRRKWKKKATTVLKRVKNWVSKGNANCVHILHLFEGEKLALAGRTYEAKKEYDLAVSSAARNGFPQDRALANERAGEMFVEAGDFQWASHYLQLAHQLYLEWEACEKADNLYGKHPKLISNG